METSMADF